MNNILQWLKENTDNPLYYYFYELSFWTGLRPSELLALTWTDITEDYIHVHKNRLDNIEKPVTKTLTARQVLLNKRSKQALQELKQYSYHYLFLCPETKQPYSSNRAFREQFNKALQATQTRKRPSYNTRHTYATMMLMDGINPTLVANQLGHSLQILINKYTRWIYHEKDKEEMEKLNTT